MSKESDLPDPELQEPVSEDVDEVDHTNEDGDAEQKTEESDKPKKPSKLDKHKHHLRRFKNWYASHKKWSIPLTVLIVLLILGGVPWTRFHIAGLVLKKNFTVEVVDSTAHKPVSGAVVSVGATSATTNGSGKALLRGVKVGSHNVSITKKYYQSQSAQLLVPILKQKSIPDVSLTATGRQVKINVTNLITKKILANVDIEIAGTSAKTDSAGNALLVLPANATTQKATLSLDGYNDFKVAVLISNTAIKENDFKLTPAGKVYYLSNQTDTLNLMKANLDGSNPEIAVNGTGTEVVNQTSMMQSPDGKYVALVTKRNDSDPTPQLYVLSTADDKLLEVDTGNANFQTYDWSGDTLVYGVQRQDLPTYQQGVNKIKAYNAASGSTTLLDQSAGSDAGDNANEYYAKVMVAGSSVVYGKTWSGFNISDKQNSLQTISINGQNHQSLETYVAHDGLAFAQHSPDTLYIYQHSLGNGDDIYSQYSVGDSLKPINLTSDQFYGDQYAYYFSPDSKQTFWSEPRDGKNTLLIADQSGENEATVASLSDYTAYGWYTDNYLLVTKDNNELYVMSTKGGTPLKIADYQATGYYGYGGY